MVSSGNLYLACDWEEWKEKCYNEEKAEVCVCGWVCMWCGSTCAHVHYMWIISLSDSSQFMSQDQHSTMVIDLRY